MSNIELTFSKPLYLLLAIPSFLVILLPFFRLPAQRRKTFRKIVPVILHLLTVSILVLILSGFTVVRHSFQKAVMLVVDLSDSTKPVQQELQGRSAQLLALIDEQTPVGVTVFGQDQVYTVKLGEDRTFATAKVEVTATDISGALEYAASLLPGDRAGHIILLSDGNQTQSDAGETALRLAARGIRVDAVHFSAAKVNLPEVQVSALKAPDGVYVGDELIFTAEIESNVQTEITLSFFDGSTLLQRQKQTVSPGSTMVELTCTAESAGMHDYQVTLETKEDTQDKNNQCYAYVDVSGKTSVLLIADTLSNAETLATVLEPDNSVTAVTVWNAPQSILELCAYDQVILSNADLALMPAGYDTLLQTYVSVYGRSLLVVGGENTLMYGGMAGTALEEMLPVSLSLEEDSDAEPVALILVLDCSTSMVQRQSYFTLAKQGAIRCVEAMSGNDYVGIVSFSSIAQVQSPLVQTTPANKDNLTRLISGLSTYRGTSYREAIELAHMGLLNSDAKTRHIIFLSDGQPYDRGYMEAVEKAAADGITVSTIGLGFSSRTLQDMAESGNGRYYYVSDATQLPNIMLSETKQIAVNSLITGNFQPVISRKSALTEELDGATLPVLDGYLGTTIKEDAISYITTEKGHPVYARWDYGKGIVGCFTSDLNGNWSSRWLQDAAGIAVIRNMVATAVDKSHHSSSMTTQITPQGQTTQITVTTADTAPSTLILSVQRAGKAETYVLTPTQPGVYSTDIQTAKPGVYELLLSQTDGNERVLDYVSTAVAVSYAKEYNAFAEGGKELLDTVCAYTGGQLYTDMEQLANLPVGARQSNFSPMVILTVLAAVLLLADIGIRKLRWKDIRNLFLRCKRK